MSLQEVGDELGVSDQTVRRWVKAGDLSAYKPGKEYRVKGSDLEEFLETREVGPKVLRPLSAEWALKVSHERMHREIRTADTAQLHKLLAELVGDDSPQTLQDLREKRSPTIPPEAFSRALEVRAVLIERGEHAPENRLPVFRARLEALHLV